LSRIDLEAEERKDLHLSTTITHQIKNGNQKSMKTAMMIPKVMAARASELRLAMAALLFSLDLKLTILNQRVQFYKILNFFIPH
jgi:hypothetical protein